MGFEVDASVTDTWLVTFACPATSAALASTAVFSATLLTGPFRVTLPSTVTILMLRAYVERLLSSTMALRIFCVTSRSALLLL